MRQLPASEYLAIKAATRDLVAVCGGPKRCEGITRGTSSRFSEYGAPQIDACIRADQIADLEAECGQPIVTRVLADMAGFDLMPRHAADKPETMHRMLADLIAVAGSMESDMAAALADGRITVSEAKRISEEASALIDRLQSLRAALKPKVVNQ